MTSFYFNVAILSLVLPYGTSRNYEGEGHHDGGKVADAEQELNEAKSYAAKVEKIEQRK